MKKIHFVWLLCFAIVLGWAAPLRAQALQLNVGPTLNGALGTNTFVLQATGGTAPYHYTLLTPVPGFRVQDGPPPTTTVLATTRRCCGRPDQPGGHQHRRGHCYAPQDRLHRQPLSRRAHDGPTRVETRQRG